MRWLCVSICLWAGCGHESSEAAPELPERTQEGRAPSAHVRSDKAAAALGPRPSGWVASRVAEARERMQSNDAARLVWDAIEAHGGLTRWHSKSTIRFEFDYQPLAQPERRMHTINSVDYWSARAHHVEVDGDAAFAWDGEEAWITPGPDAFPSPARFWALTPYYFVAMPFVAADPGTHLERLEDAELDGVVHRIVKLTYGENVGDAPDDYYVLYLHPDTKRLSALRYVVSYAAFFPEGGHSPEKLMRYSDYQQVDGLWLAGRLDTSSWDPERAEPGDVVTRIVARDIELGLRFDASLFAKPDGATISGL